MLPGHGPWFLARLDFRIINSFGADKIPINILLMINL